MRKLLYILVAAILLPICGCTVRRGTFDFANPWFDLHCGPLTFIAFHDPTVVHIGGTYLTLYLPFYAPVFLLLVLVGFFLRSRECSPK